jgi:DMSO reductase anchor subunit
MKVLVMIAIILAIVILAPVATIWSLNTLFPILNIPLTLDTWMATIILGSVVGGGISRSNK